MSGQSPQLSAILAVERLEQGSETIEVLRERAGEVPLELVLVGIAAEPPEPPEPTRFAAVTVVHEPGATLAEARAAGARGSAAELVVICETHSFPEPGWARGLVERFEEGWAAVGPRIRPFNPSRRAVAATIFDYGRWMSGPEGSWSDLPGHNSAYRRDALISALDEMPDGMDAETLLQERIRAAGGRLYLDLGAGTRHMNMELYSGAIGEWLVFSRVYAVRRSREWGRLRRAVYAAGSVLLPLIRLPRFVAAARRGGLMRRFLAGADLFAVIIVASAFGEMLGYATGRCDPAGTLRYELDRRSWSPSAPPLPTPAADEPLRRGERSLTG